MQADRRAFLKSLTTGTAVAHLSGNSSQCFANSPLPEYQGPNVIVIRFGGGVRRRETIDPMHTYAPYFAKILAKRGTLFTNMSIESLEGVQTSHGEGTLYILTGKYDRFKDVSDKFLGARFEAKVPTIFEYLRKSYQISENETLIINSEDRTDEEFYSFSNHHLFGANYRSNVLSLYRFKIWKLREQLSRGMLTGKALEAGKKELAQMEVLDYRNENPHGHNPQMMQFWSQWSEHYGDSGLVNPRGDRLLTELAIRAMEQLQPKLMMINYNDPDYVHWGYMSHYTRGISIIDQGIRSLTQAVERNQAYRDNTVFVIVPDCGRDTNLLQPVPCQHHFNSRSSHEIFALLVGPGIAKNTVVDKPVTQASIAATIGEIMQFRTDFSEGPVLEQAFS